MPDVFEFLAEKTLPGWSPVALSIELTSRVKKSNSETHDTVQKTTKLIDESLKITRQPEEKTTDNDCF